MLIGIIGSRRRNTQEDFNNILNIFFKIYNEGDWIVSGGCPEGGDNFAEIIAKEYGIPILIFYPKWKVRDENNKVKFIDKSAGNFRNIFIAKWSEILIACVAEDRKGGTEDTILKFKEKYNNNIKEVITSSNILVLKPY